MDPPDSGRAAPPKESPEKQKQEHQRQPSRDPAGYYQSPYPPVYPHMQQAPQEQQEQQRSRAVTDPYQAANTVIPSEQRQVAGIHYVPLPLPRRLQQQLGRGPGHTRALSNLFSPGQQQQPPPQQQHGLQQQRGFQQYGLQQQGIQQYGTQQQYGLQQSGYLQQHGAHQQHGLQQPGYFQQHPAIPQQQAPQLHRRRKGPSLGNPASIDALLPTGLRQHVAANPSPRRRTSIDLTSRVYHGEPREPRQLTAPRPRRRSGRATPFQPENVDTRMPTGLDQEEDPANPSNIDPALTGHQNPQMQRRRRGRAATVQHGNMGPPMPAGLYQSDAAANRTPNPLLLHQEPYSADPNKDVDVMNWLTKQGIAFQVHPGDGFESTIMIARPNEALRRGIYGVCPPGENFWLAPGDGGSKLVILRAHPSTFGIGFGLEGQSQTLSSDHLAQQPIFKSNTPISIQSSTTAKSSNSTSYPSSATAPIEDMARTNPHRKARPANANNNQNTQAQTQGVTGSNDQKGKGKATDNLENSQDVADPDNSGSASPQKVSGIRGGKDTPSAASSSPHGHPGMTHGLTDASASQSIQRDMNTPSSRRMMPGNSNVTGQTGRSVQQQTSNISYGRPPAGYEFFSRQERVNPRAVHGPQQRAPASATSTRPQPEFQSATSMMSSNSNTAYIGSCQAANNDMFQFQGTNPTTNQQPFSLSSQTQAIAGEGPFTGGVSRSRDDSLGSSLGSSFGGSLGSAHSRGNSLGGTGTTGQESQYDPAAFAQYMSGIMQMSARLTDAGSANARQAPQAGFLTGKKPEAPRDPTAELPKDLQNTNYQYEDFAREYNGPPLRLVKLPGQLEHKIYGKSANHRDWNPPIGWYGCIIRIEHPEQGSREFDPGHRFEDPLICGFFLSENMKRIFWRNYCELFPVVLADKEATKPPHEHSLTGPLELEEEYLDLFYLRYKLRHQNLVVSGMVHRMVVNGPEGVAAERVTRHPYYGSSTDRDLDPHTFVPGPMSMEELERVWDDFEREKAEEARVPAASSAEAEKAREYQEMVEIFGEEVAAKIEAKAKADAEAYRASKAQGSVEAQAQAEAQTEAQPEAQGQAQAQAQGEGEGGAEVDVNVAEAEQEAGNTGDQGQAPEQDPPLDQNNHIWPDWNSDNGWVNFSMFPPIEEPETASEFGDNPFGPDHDAPAPPQQEEEE